MNFLKITQANSWQDLGLEPFSSAYQLPSERPPCGFWLHALQLLSLWASAKGQLSPSFVGLSWCICLFTHSTSLCGEHKNLSGGVPGSGDRTAMET